MTVNVRSSPVVEGEDLASPTAVPFGFTAEAGRMLALTGMATTDVGDDQVFTAPSGWQTAYNYRVVSDGFRNILALFWKISDGTETTVSAVHLGNGGVLFQVHEFEVEGYFVTALSGSDTALQDLAGTGDTNELDVATTTPRAFCFTSTYSEGPTPEPPPYASVAGERWRRLSGTFIASPFPARHTPAYYEHDGAISDNIDATWSYGATHYSRAGLAVFELEPIQEPDMLGLFLNLVGTVKNTFRIAKAKVLATSLTVAREFTLPDKSGTLALTEDVVTMAKSILSATQANSTTTPATLTDCTFTLLPGQTMQLNAVLIFTAAATGTGGALGVRVAQGSGADANAQGSAYAIVSVANAAGAGALSDGDAFNVAANANSLWETVGTASTSGNNGAAIRAVVHNASTNANTTVTVEFRSEVGGSAVTAQIGSGATAIIG